MFCKKCGTAISAEEKFCSKCGEAKDLVAPTKKVSNTHIGIIACAVIGVVALVMVISAFSGRGQSNASRVVISYASAVALFDFTGAAAYLPISLDQTMESFARAEGLTMRELNNQIRTDTGYRDVNAFLDSMTASLQTLLEDDLGGRIRASVEILNYTTLDTTTRLEELSTFRRNFNNQAQRNGIDLRWEDFVNVNDITEMMRFDINVILSGNHDSFTSRDSILVMRMGRRWYVLESSIDIAAGW